MVTYEETLLILCIASWFIIIAAFWSGWVMARVTEKPTLHLPSFSQRKAREKDIDTLEKDPFQEALTELPPADDVRIPTTKGENV
jgi:hypothetical protein